MKIGIGCLTYNRPEHLELWKEQTIRNVSLGTPFRIYYADDSQDRKGIAYRSNECLRALKDCDYVFIFNDDCFPIKQGWAEWFIRASRKSQQQHFLFLKETPTIKFIKHYVGEFDFPQQPLLQTPILEYNNCAGCFMFLTKEAIEKVGAFDERFGRYGFEHCQYSDRVHSAGLTPLGKYLCPAGAGEYIYSLDLDNHLPFNKQLNHKPSMGVKETMECLKVSQQVYNLKDKPLYLPL